MISILSGDKKFGIGKTYFLNEFFKNSNKYDCYHLFPVNYQISSNENVIEFLKYDILIELFKKDKNIFKDNKLYDFIDLTNLAYLWLEGNLVNVFKNAISYIPKLGKPVNESIGLLEKFIKFKTELEDGDKGFINGFINDIKKKNIEENDLISELIRKKVLKQKGERDSVLILDDLDRIDPEHIFRILNIFSAHFNINNDELPNKFGFDKIIIVGDVENLKSIFYHKYGKNTDFNGYFDKFYNIEIFNFDNSELIVKLMDKIFENFKIQNPDLLGDAIRNHGYIRLLILDVITKAINIKGKEKLDLRQVLKGTKYPLPILNSNVPRNLSGINFLDIALICLISIVGGLEKDLLGILKIIKVNSVSIKENDKYDELYARFSFHMLKKIFKLDNIDVESKIGNDKKPIEWNGYEIIIGGGSVHGGFFIDKVVESSEGKRVIFSSEIYYILLIYYLENQFYNNGGVSDLCLG